jgi:hypothetical protein
MKTNPIQYRSASKHEFSEPPPKPKIPSGCELRPGLIALLRAQPFSGHYNENPCHHLHGFEEMCSCLSISSMTRETLKSKVFPLSLTEKAKQWYTYATKSMNGDWNELKDKFHLAFFPMFHIDSLPRAIFDFEQCKK